MPSQFMGSVKWESLQDFESRAYKCGYCGLNISSNKGYKRTDGNNKIKG